MTGNQGGNPRRVVIAVVFIATMVTMGACGREPQRGRVPSSLQSMRVCNDVANKYRAIHGHYPPRLDGEVFYGPFRDELGLPTPLTDPSKVEHPYVDPNRKDREFSEEQPIKSAYSAGSGKKRSFKGYPFRYFRDAEGEFAILLSNGPDGDVDVVREDLLRVVERGDGSDETIDHLKHLRYDATNGTYSSGDVWRVFRPRSP